MIKNSPPNAGEVGSIPGSGRCPGEGNGNPLQYGCLGNAMDRGAWWPTVVMGLQRVRHDLVTKQQQQSLGDQPLSIIYNPSWGAPSSPNPFPTEKRPPDRAAPLLKVTTTSLSAEKQLCWATWRKRSVFITLVPAGQKTPAISTLFCSLFNMDFSVCWYWHAHQYPCHLFHVVNS